MRGSRVVALLALAVGWLGLSGCAARGFAPPAPTGKAAPADLRVWESLAPCSEIKTLTAEAALSGRVEGQRVRGRLHLGLSRGGGIRIEAVAPFGGPIFTLAGLGSAATLALPRDGRVVTNAPTRDLLDAVAGVALDPGDLLSLAIGCLGFDDTVATDSGDPPVQAVAGGLVWARSTRGTDVWFDVRSRERPRVVAARQGDLIVDYPGRGDAWPQTFRLRRLTANGRATADLELRMSQVETNVALPESAFTVAAPPDARPMTIDELRRTGLFGSR